MPHRTIPSKHRVHARTMRHLPTDAEARLWTELRDRRLNGAKFRRQVPVGGFIADFVCVESRLIVEVDGSQHAESSYDLRRDVQLQDRGFRIIRFWNDDVMRDLDAVCATIMAYLEDPTLQPAYRRPAPSS